MIILIFKSTAGHTVTLDLTWAPVPELRIKATSSQAKELLTQIWSCINLGTWIMFIRMCLSPLTVCREQEGSILLVAASSDHSHWGTCLQGSTLQTAGLNPPLNGGYNPAHFDCTCVFPLCVIPDPLESARFSSGFKRIQCTDLFERFPSPNTRSSILYNPRFWLFAEIIKP